MTRRDGLGFPVARTGRVLQLAHLDNGMEMIWVVKLLQKSGETKQRVQYYSVLRTSDAIQESPEEHDLDLGGGHVHLGKLAKIARAGDSLPREFS